MKKIKVFCAVLLCKLLRKIGSLIGRGSSLPGAIVLKLFPNILSLIDLPDKIIAVTGSNGKTSTVEMIAHILRYGGKKVAWNREGSNQIEGVTTFLLCACSLSGKVNSDIVLLESDERFARHTFKYFRPTDYIITNLYRDQLTRNGHPEWVYHAIEQSIYPETRLILNADDPLVSKFGNGREGTLYFGADPMPFDTDSCKSIYHDGAYCPVCCGKMNYDYYHYNHIGSFSCPSCGYHRQDTRWSLTNADLENGTITVNGKYTIALSFNSLYQCYNTLAAFAAADIAGIAPETAVKAMEEYHLKSGRILSYEMGNSSGTVLTSKHENSISYDQSIRVVQQDNRESAVLIIVDAVSRKYFTSETSWLWDIDFENLCAPQIKQVILAGKYCWDLRSRFAFTDIEEDKLSVYESIPEAAKALENADVEARYVITCFSDKGKFTSLDGVKITGGI